MERSDRPIQTAKLIYFIYLVNTAFLIILPSLNPNIKALKIRIKIMHLRHLKQTN